MSKPVCVIMAGGKGERFWPLSRLRKPKQLLPITGGEPMIVETIQRILPLVEPSEIIILTNHLQKGSIEKLLPDIPKENIIGEPVGRSTAPCIGFAAVLTLAKFGAQKPMIILSADHHIEKDELFRDILRTAVQRAGEKEVLITLGIKPSRPDTGYGYIQVGEKRDTIGNHNLHKVLKFLEKPDLKTARIFLEKGNYLWNSGMFIWRCDVILNAFQKHLPQMYEAFMSQKDSIAGGDIAKALEISYSKVESISVDYGIMEKADEVEVIESDIAWDDVGSWLVLERLHKPDGHGNITLIPTLKTDTENCIITGEKGTPLIVSLGIKDLVIVQTPDALLIADKGHLEKIKNIVKTLSENQDTQHLT